MSRVYVSHADQDDPVAIKAFMDAVVNAGHELVDDLSGDVDGAVVLVGPAALDSSKVIAETHELLKRQATTWFPVVPLLLTRMSLAELRSSGLNALTNIQISRASDFTDRITEALAALDSTSRHVTFRASSEPHKFTTTRLITIGTPVAAVAFATVDGRPALAAGCEDSTIRIWQLRDQAARQLVLEGHTGPVWSVAFGRLDERDIVVSGSDDGTIRVWDAATGAHQHTLKHHRSPVNSVVMEGDLAFSGGDDRNMILWNLTGSNDPGWIAHHPDFVNGVAIAGGGTVATACSDGIVRIWDPQEGSPRKEFTGHTDSVSSVAASHSTIFSGSLDGTVRAWNVDTGEETYRFDAHPGGVRTVAVGIIGAVGTVVSGGNDGLIQLWGSINDPKKKWLEGHTGPVRSVAIGTLNGKSIVVSGGDDGTIRVWGDNTADHVEWLSDAPSDEDLLVRRPLARSIATRLRRMNSQEPGTSFLVHIDGPWGAGKSTLVKFLQKELEPDFTPINFNAWSEAGVGPAWWALLTALRTAVGKQRRWPGRMWLRLRESLARLRRVGAPFVLALAGLLVLAGGIWWLFNPTSVARAQDIVKSATGILATIGTVGAGALVASRFLLWDSARGARLFEQSNTNPMLEVTRHFGWLMARSKRPVVFFIDDLDRCPDTYVVELLDNVQTLVRDTGKPSAHFVVSADGAWIRTSYELAYEKFSSAVAAPGQPLGYLFLDKFFQLRIPVPSIDAPRQQQYLRELLRGPVKPSSALADEEGRVREQLTRSTTEAQVVAALQSASAEVRDRVAGTALDKLTTPEAVAATEHSLQRFAPLLPPNPRAMKRFVNAYSALRAVRTLEGNPVRVESLALWTIIEIRWPSLADHLRAHPESIGLVGSEELDAVPETLRMLFRDPALRLIAGFDQEFDANVIRSCCGVSIPVTDR